MCDIVDAGVHGLPGGAVAHGGVGGVGLGDGVEEGLAAEVGEELGGGLRGEGDQDGRNVGSYLHGIFSVRLSGADSVPGLGGEGLIFWE